MTGGQKKMLFIYQGRVYYYVTSAYLEQVERALYDALVCDYYFGGGHATTDR